MREQTIREMVEKGMYQMALSSLDKLEDDLISHDLIKIEINRELGHYNQAWKIIQRLYDKITDEENIIALRVEEAYLLYREGKIIEAMSTIQAIQENFSTLDQFSSMEGKIAFIKSYSLAGNLSWRQSKFDLMEQNYEIALQMAQELDHQYSIIHSLIGLGNAAKSQGYLISAISYYETALFTATNTENKKFEAYCRNNLGENYRMLGRIDEAIEQFTLADEYFSSELSMGTMSVTAMNLGLCHYIREEHKIALQYFNYALQLAKEVNYKYQILDIFIHMLLIQVKENNTNAISEIYQNYLDLFHNEVDELFDQVSKLIKGIYHYSQKNLKDRVQALEIFEQLSDETFEFEYEILVLIYLIEIKLDEYIIYGQKKELQALDKIFDRINDIENISPVFKVRILMLQAKLSEIKGDLQHTFQQYRAALSLAKTYGLDNQRFEIVDVINKLKKRYDDEQTSIDGKMIISDQEIIDNYLDHLKRNMKS